MSHAEYLNDYEAKHQILEVGRRMYEKGFVASNDGNISCRVSETELWTTPTGVSKGFMTEEMLVKVDLNGNLLRVMRFEQPDEVIDLGKLNEEFSGHGGGDAHLLDAFLHLIAQDAPIAKGITDISDSVESHLVAYAAERSRLRGGAVETL